MRLGLPEVVMLRPARFEDERGFFSESFNRQAFSDATGLNTMFVQDNLSFSRATHTVRGLHYQRPPHAQAKLVSCLAGRIFDVAVDGRTGSESYGRGASTGFVSLAGWQYYGSAGFPARILY